MKNTTSKTSKTRITSAAKPVRKRSLKAASRTTKTVTKKLIATTRAKKTVQRRGITHHAKRLYHVTPKFIHGMVAGALVGLAVVGILSAKTAFDASPASADTGCDAHGIGSNTLTHSTNNSAYTIKGNQTTVTFDVVGKNCKLPITIVVWKAPNGTTGQPYSQQTLFYHKSATFSTGRHSMTATLPDCYFQVDTVTGTKLTGSTGQAYNYDTRQVAFMHGGTKSCTATPPKTVTTTTATTPTTPTPTPQPVTIQVCDLTSKEIVPIDESDFTTSQYTKDLAVCQNAPTPITPIPTTPDTPVSVQTASAQTLPNTGAGAVILIAIMSIAGGFIVHKTHHHHKKRKHTQHHAR